MKVCFKCNIEKDIGSFYRHSQMKDGHLNKCIDCTKFDTKLRASVLVGDPYWQEKERERQRDKYYRLGYKEKHKPDKEYKKIAMDKYKEKYPEKIRAKNKSQHIKVEIKGNHLHHWSYNDEHFKDIIEMTPKEHYLIHRYIKYDQERKMYRTLEGVLLDTRLESLKYYGGLF